MSALLDHYLDLLGCLGDVRARAMFGGWGLYAGAAMLALVADDELFLKVDERTRDAFVAAGCEPFVWDGPRGAVTFSYYRPPPAALESPDEMERWARLALEAARRAKASGAGSRRPARAVTAGRGTSAARRRPRGRSRT